MIICSAVCDAHYECDDEMDGCPRTRATCAKNKANVLTKNGRRTYCPRTIALWRSLTRYCMKLHFCNTCNKYFFKNYPAHVTRHAVYCSVEEVKPIILCDVLYSSWNSPWNYLWICSIDYVATVSFSLRNIQLTYLRTYLRKQCACQSQKNIVWKGVVCWTFCTTAIAVMIISYRIMSPWRRVTFLKHHALHGDLQYRHSVAKTQHHAVRSDTRLAGPAAVLQHHALGEKLS